MKEAIGFYVLWFGLAALAVVVAFQFQITFVYLGILLIQSPFKPPAWNSSNIAGISRCGYLIVGALWIGLVFYLEKYLEAGLEAGRLWTCALRAALALGAVYLVCTILLYVLG